MTDNAFLGQVYANPHVPSVTGTYFSVHPADQSGTPAEGSGGTLVNESVTVLVFVPRGRAPVAGNYLVCHRVRQAFASPPTDYWVALL